jgi:hypothetical protein
MPHHYTGMWSLSCLLQSVDTFLYVPLPLLEAGFAPGMREVHTCGLSQHSALMPADLSHGSQFQQVADCISTACQPRTPHPNIGPHTAQETGIVLCILNHSQHILFIDSIHQFRDGADNYCSAVCGERHVRNLTFIPLSLTLTITLTLSLQ